MNKSNEVQYDREALLYKGDAWELASKGKISYAELFEFLWLLPKLSTLNELQAEYEKLLALANSRESVDDK